MLRYLSLIGLPLLLLSTPASAVTAKQKMETCKFGADSEHLTGAKRNTFIKHCMAKGDYEPAARKAMKKHPPQKKHATKPATKNSTAQKPASPAPKPQ